MHSGADVEAFTAALNRDIEGDSSTFQPSDSDSGMYRKPFKLSNFTFFKFLVGIYVLLKESLCSMITVCRMIRLVIDNLSCSCSTKVRRWKNQLFGDEFRSFLRAMWIYKINKSHFYNLSNWEKKKCMLWKPLMDRNGFALFLFLLWGATMSVFYIYCLCISF